MRVRRLLTALLLIHLAPFAAAQDLFDQTVVRDFEFTFKQTNWWQLVQGTRFSGTDVKADLRVDGVTFSDVGFRVKGASSSSVRSSKLPFNLTMDSFQAGQSLYGFETLNLNNGAYDPTLTRETISYEIFRNYIPAPRTNYVRVHLNGTFWGVYILVEQPNKDLLRTWFRDTSGTRFKGDRPSGAAVNTSTLNYLGASIGPYQSQYELKTPGNANAWQDLVRMIDRLNNLPAARFKQEIVQYINVDRVLWYLACNNIVVNSDDYMGAGHNYYMYFDPQNGQMNILPWDLNEAFGVHGPSTNPWLYLVNHMSTSSIRPLVRRIFAVPEWHEMYFAHYRTILNRWMDWQNVLGPLNKRFQDRIRADVTREPNYLFNKIYFNPSFAGRIFFNGHYIHGLKEVVEGRATFLKSRLNLRKAEPQLSAATYPRGVFLPGQRIPVTVQVRGTPAIRTVVVRTTADGLYQDLPMFDDGRHGDGQAGDGIYGGTVVARTAGLPTRFYFHATDTAGTVQVLPAEAEHVFYSIDVGFPPPSGDLVLNEILADNDTTDQDPAGDFDDWVELHNRGANAIDASGVYLSDDPLAPKKWRLPANTTIPAGGYLRIWCDGEPGEGPLHAPFKIRKAGETLLLTDTDANGNKLLDGIRLGQQKADRSFGRVPDGSPRAFFVWTPSGNGPVTGTGPGRVVRFDARRTGAPSGMDLLPTGAARLGQVLSLTIQGGPANAAAIVGLSLGNTDVPLGPAGHLLLDPSSLVLTGIRLDASGGGGVSGTVPASAVNATLYSQGVAGTELSNGVVLRVSR